MPEMTAEVALTLAAALLGAAAHRGGLCTVRAAAEVLTTRRAHILWSFLKASFWTTSFLALAAAAGHATPLASFSFEWIIVAGGLLFGIGAAMNGACALSTFARLSEGHVAMGFAPLGWLAGMAAVARVAPGTPPAEQASALPGWLAMPAVVWIGAEGVRLARRLRRDGLGPGEAAAWPLSLAVLVIAGAYTALLLASAPWSFTSTALCTARAGATTPCEATGLLWLLSGAAFAGMLGSAVLRGSFRLRRPRLRATLRHLGAGATMGAGAALIPGGNDGLILFGLPSLSPHSLPAWLAIVAGVLLTLAAMRQAGTRLPRIRCEADVCRAVS